MEPRPGRGALVLVLAFICLVAVGCAQREMTFGEPAGWTSTTPPERASTAAGREQASAVSEPEPPVSPSASALDSVQGVPGGEEAVPEEFTGVYHEVNAGETLWRIAKTYGVDLETLQWVNDVEDVTDLRIGRILFIPGVREVRIVPPAVPEDLAPPPVGKISVSWPLKGRLSSGFGPRGHRRHEGIDLAAATGTPVRAAAPGKVVYSGSGMRGYGKVVVLKHEKEVSTVYAHNSVLLVKMGEVVRQGQVIARVGSTGWATGPHLHFEVRKRGVAENPMSYLPPL